MHPSDWIVDSKDQINQVNNTSYYSIDMSSQDIDYKISGDVIHNNSGYNFNLVIYPNKYENLEEMTLLFSDNNQDYTIKEINNQE